MEITERVALGSTKLPMVLTDCKEIMRDRYNSSFLAMIMEIRIKSHYPESISKFSKCFYAKPF